MDSCLAVDIGGTKLAAGVVTAEGELVAHQQVPTPEHADAEGLFEVLAGLVNSVISARTNDLLEGRQLLGSVMGGSGMVAGGLLGCGVGCGGPMSEAGEEVSPLNIPSWVSFPLRSRLESLTGLAVTVENDAKALALGEGWVGVAKQSRNFMGMVVSTGVGGGIVVDGRLVDGRSGNAGHIGHVIVEPGGRQCRCGARGCLEAEASGIAIAEMTGRPPMEASPEIVTRTGRLVGMAVASVTNLLDLELTLIAGSVALGFGRPFFDAASREFADRSRISFTSGARIEPAGLGSFGPLIGAGAVAWRALDRQVVGSGHTGEALMNNPHELQRDANDDGGAITHTTSGHVEPGHAEPAHAVPGSGAAARGMFAVARIVAVKPYLWFAALLQGFRLAGPDWWRKWPPLPIPSDRLWRLRMLTAYGGDGSALPDPDDVTSYLEWCRTARQWQKR